MHGINVSTTWGEKRQVLVTFSVIVMTARDTVPMFKKINYMKSAKDLLRGKHFILVCFIINKSYGIKRKEWTDFFEE